METMDDPKGQYLRHEELRAERDRILARNTYPLRDSGQNRLVGLGVIGGGLLLLYWAAARIWGLPWFW
jgi:hypothetical protein